MEPLDQNLQVAPTVWTASSTRGRAFAFLIEGRVSRSRLPSDWRRSPPASARDRRAVGLVGLGGIGSCTGPSGFVGWRLVSTRPLDRPGGPRRPCEDSAPCSTWPPSGPAHRSGPCSATGSPSPTIQALEVILNQFLLYGQTISSLVVSTRGTTTPRPQLLDPALAKRSSSRALGVGLTGERRPEPQVGARLAAAGWPRDLATATPWSGPRSGRPR
jgi:hypothetical protein